MARSILISELEKTKGDGGVSFAYNTFVFEVISEGIRAGFTKEENECMKQCFEDLDEMGAEYICLYDVTPTCFKKFVAACERGLQHLKDTKEFAIDREATETAVNGISVIWERLLDELRRDPRYTQS